MSFSNLKKTNNDEALKALKEKVQNSRGNQEDLFSPGIDAAHNGYIRCRFLPGENGIDHIVSYIKLTFKNGAKTYENKSRRSIGEDDPCQEYKSALWEVERKEDARKIKRKELFVGYIYVYEDKIKPDNNGKVFKYYMPKTLVKMTQEAIDPPKDPFGEPKESFNPFDIFCRNKNGGGRDFIIRVKEKEGYNNYEDSHFVDEPTPWLDDEAKMEELWTEHVKDLTSLRDPSKFKSYDDLLKQLAEVVGRSDPVFNQVFGEKLAEITGGKRPSESKPKEEKPEATQEEKKIMEKSSEISMDDFEDDDDDFNFEDD